MNIYSSRWLGRCLMAAMAAACLNAQAQDAVSVSANLAVTSHYVSRGFSQSWGRPALQGGVDVAHASGLFAGVWASTLSDKAFRDGRAEVDLYGGYAGTLADWGYELGVYQYLYPGSSSPFVSGHSYRYTEAKAGLSKGAFSFATYVTISRRYFGTFDSGRGALYFDANYAPNLGDGWSLLLHVGAGVLPEHSQANWVDYKLGLNKALPNDWAVSLAATYAKDRNRFWTSADLSHDRDGLNPERRLGRPAVALTVSKLF